MDAAQALVTSATATLFSAINAVLDGTPLVSLGSLDVSTKAAVTSAKADETKPKRAAKATKAKAEKGA